MKQLLTIFLIFFCIQQSLYAQENSLRYFELPVHGKLFETPAKYRRVRTAKYNAVPSALKRLDTQSACLFETFKPSPPEPYDRWCVTDRQVGRNPTAIANKGL